MKLKILKPTKFKIITAIVILIVIISIGVLFIVCIECMTGDTSWRCGCNPFFGLMPWIVFVPFSVVSSYAIACLIAYFLKRNEEE